MCGFSGIFSKSNIPSGAIVQSIASIKHRGPDDSLILSYNEYSKNANYYSVPFSNNDSKNAFPTCNNLEANNWIGFNRLSIVDLSNNGMQPLYDPTSDTAFLFNGEIYNYKELQKTYLREKKLTSSSDSEVAFQLYLLMGAEFVTHLHGMFSIVIIDYTQGFIRLWRDPMGIKPLFYYLDKEVFIFSSEIKGILQSGLVSTELDYRNIAYSCYLGTCPSPLTIYKNIVSVEPAHFLQVDLDNFSHYTKAYWQLDYTEASNIIRPTDFLEDIQSKALQSITGEVPKSVMLSGGIDSGLLAYAFKDFADEISAINIYNQQFESTNENYFAQLNAQNANIRLTSIDIANELTASYIQWMAGVEEDPNEEPEAGLLAAKSAANTNTKILYNALGLDELLGGYEYYYTAQKMNQYKWTKPLIPLAGAILKGKKEKLDTLYRFGIEAMPFIVRNHFAWSTLQHIFSDYNSSQWQHPVEYVKAQVERANRAFKHFPLLKKISYLDYHYYIGSHHSFRGDQASMQYSVEMRFPFLDHTFFQKYFNAATIFDGLSDKRNKPFARKAASLVLPKEILTMPKKGFHIPNKIIPEHQHIHDTILQLPFYEKLEKSNLLNSAGYWKWYSLATIEHGNIQ